MSSAWLAFAVSFIFGVEPVIFRTALTQFAAEDIVWLRFAGALPCFIILARGMRPLSPWALVAGCFLAVNYLGFLKGISLSGPTASTILLQSSSFLFVALSVITKETKVTRSQLAALLLTLMGYFFYFEDVGSSTEFTRQTLTGFVWVILSALGWACYAVLTRREKKIDSAHKLTAQSFVVALLLLSTASHPTQLLGATSGQAATLLLIVSFTVIAYSCLGLALQRGKAAVIAPIIATNPLITLIALALEQFLIGGPGISPPLTIVGLIGVSLIVVGVALVTRE